MLRYDAAWLIEQYRDEVPAAPGLPYTRIGGPGPYRVVCHDELFQLDDVLRLTPRFDHEERVVRLVTTGADTLHVQPALYSAGLKSNYAMDGPGELRDILHAEYGAQLPPLTDTRLSNGIGTAVVVFDSARRPYFPRRARGQSVFPGGWHCTASGETIWNGMCDFDGVFTSQACLELEEEVGLRREDLDWIRPVAFCREFLRAGKPQLFFTAATSLSPAELAQRRRIAIESQLARGRQEIEDEVLDDVTPESLQLCTLECRAALALAQFQ